MYAQLRQSLARNSFSTTPTTKPPTARSAGQGKEYAGQTVTVIGNYDRATSTLHVDRIETEM